MKYISLLLLLSMTVYFSPALAVWKDCKEEKVQSHLQRQLTPDKYRMLRLDYTALKSILNQCTSKGAINNSEVIIQIPKPDGGLESFAVYKTQVMAPELSIKYPAIKTYSGYSLSDISATIHLDVTYKGFHAMVLSDQGQYFIDPYASGNDEFYISYFKRDCNRQYIMHCEWETSYEQMDKSLHQEKIYFPTPIPQYSNGTELRSYRLALACTGEYASYHGGTKPLVLSAMVTTMNRVNGVYEKEISATMQLVANNDLVIFLSAGSDPYTNNNGGTMLGQNQTTLNTIIGSPNYDIGHVFSTGGGGIAALASVCKTNKAQGVTGLSTPIGDPFDIDYVAHEMGHQFGGNHTFNGNSGACSGNINTNTAYEPGSGSTIMAYAGICSPQNLQNNSNAYFHSASFFEMVNYTVLGTGNSCSNQSITNNTPPVAILNGSAFTIPISTSFILHGAGFDADGDSLSYSWEQIDLGPAGNPNSPTGNAPLFRSFTPVNVPYRYFPKIQNIVTNTTSIGEKLPSYARNMKFRLMVRDNRLGGGGSSYNDTLVNISVHNSGAPFLVTYPNTALSWTGTTNETVTWDVVGTDQTPINTPFVDILLSTDGGFTYPITLLSNTPNDGSEIIVVPNISSNQARIMVKGAGNIFFDISNTNFSITPFVGIDEFDFESNFQLMPNPTQNEYLDITLMHPFEGVIQIQLMDAKGSIVNDIEWTKKSSESNIQLETSNLTSGLYYVRLKLGNHQINKAFLKTN